MKTGPAAMMRRATPLFALFPLLSLPCLVGATAARAQETPPKPANPYEPGPDSRPQPGVPKGEVIKFSFEKSKIFPGTVRDVWVYVPAQYTPDKPACVYVNQDGVQWNAPTVFDNLIAKKEMPITIGVFVMHGRVKAADGKAALDRFNRSYEYDGLGDNYARFLLEELLPHVETMKTGDGRPIRLSRDGNDRAIGGSSSGAVCAFTAAWERPDAFSRVFSVIGTYVGLRGAERYSTLVRKYEPKPIRIFLQDGSNDLNIYGGDWWMANQSMERSLTFAGYEVSHVWGELGHDGRQGSQVFPDAMRWLWKDWPQPVKAGRGRNGMLNDIVSGDEPWQAVGEGYQKAGAVAVDPKGNVLFADVATGRTYAVGADGKAAEAPIKAGRASGQAFAADGTHYAVDSGKGQVLATGADGKAKTLAKGSAGPGDVVVANNGNAFAALGGRQGGGVWLVPANGGRARQIDTGINAPGGVTLSPDQTLLYVNDARSHWVYSYQIQPDGTLAHKQRYYWLHSPDADGEDGDDSGAAGMCVDSAGRLYVATTLGVQVADQAGRVNVILPLPGREAATGVCIGGEKLDTLYVTTPSRVFRRKLKATGSPAWQAPHRPNPPGL